MIFRIALFGVVLGCGLMLGLPIAAAQFGTPPLDAVEQDVAAQFADVRQLETGSFAQMLRAPGDIIVFDVRESAEFEVSRIPGALRVDPGTWSSTFLKQHSSVVRDKTIVFYCSVGVRSSKLAGRVQDELRRAGAVQVYNLRGGIFRWHNEERSLVDASGAETPYIHPYDSRWARLVDRGTLVRQAP
jgi:rhodanese-related sulfurtransferase